MSRLVFAHPYTDSYCYDLGASKAMVPRLFVVYPFQAPNNLLSAQDLAQNVLTPMVATSV